MDERFWILGVMKVKRGPGAPNPYTIEELGSNPVVQLTGNDEVDLVPLYGGQWPAVVNLIDKCKNAKLNIDIAAGTIVVSERTDPVELSS